MYCIILVYSFTHNNTVLISTFILSVLILIMRWDSIWIITSIWQSVCPFKTITYNFLYENIWQKYWLQNYPGWNEINLFWFRIRRNQSIDWCVNKSSLACWVCHCHHHWSSGSYQEHYQPSSSCRPRSHQLYPFLNWHIDHTGCIHILHIHSGGTFWTVWPVTIWQW